MDRQEPNNGASQVEMPHESVQRAMNGSCISNECSASSSDCLSAENALESRRARTTRSHPDKRAIETMRTTTQTSHIDF
jgi:hypothetical protein